LPSDVAYSVVYVLVHTGSNTWQNVGRGILLILYITCETKDQSKKKKRANFETQYDVSSIKINKTFCSSDDNRIICYVTVVFR